MELELSDILDLNWLQATLEVYSKKLKSSGIDVAFAILNEEANPVVYETNFNDFCTQIRKSKIGVCQCNLSDKTLIKAVADNFYKNNRSEPLFHVCKLGLMDFCAPIIINNEIIAYFFGGQIRVEEGFECDGKTVKSLDIPNLQELKQRFNESSFTCTTFEYFESLERSFKQIRILNKKKLLRLRRMIEIFVEDLNAFVFECHECHYCNLFNQFLKKTTEVRNIDELFKLVVNKLPGILKTKYCSIFIVQKGTPDEEDRLVLWETNYQNNREVNSPPNKLDVKSSCYKKNEQNRHLTAWVWANARPLLLEDITNDQELKRYGISRLCGKYNDSDEHKGFLAAPIIGYDQKVIGLIRMPHKTGVNGREIRFTRRDSIFLEFVAQHLAPIIERQELIDHQKQTSSLVNCAQDLARMTSYKEVIESTIHSAVLLFGGGTGKKYFLNRYTPSATLWKIVKTAGDLGINGDCEGQKFPNDRGLTSRILREKKPILLHNLDEAITEGHYLEAVPGGESAMAAPLTHKDKIYGVIAVVSEKKFIFSDHDLEMLKRLGQLSGEAIVRTRWFFIKELVKQIWNFIPLFPIHVL